MSVKIIRRQWLMSASALAATLAHGPGPRAQSRPDIARFLCGYPAGGSIDVVTRKLAERLTGDYARSVVVDNKPGAAGRLAVEDLKKTPPDGTTLLITPASIVTMYTHVYRKLSYDVFADLTPVSVVANTAFALAVGPKVPATVQNVDDFIRWCRANPSLAQCANAGSGSMPHFMAMLVARETGIDLVHVPYRGGLAAMQDAAAGQVSAALATEAAALALEQADRLRVLATTGAQRSIAFPRTATFESQGFRQLTRTEWFGAFMVGRTPANAVSRANEVLRGALREPDIRDAWHKLALTPDSSSPAELQAMMRSEYDFWEPFVKASGFTPQA